MVSKVRKAISILINEGPPNLIKATSKSFFFSRRQASYRDELKQDQDLKVAEVGVWKGDHAQVLLEDLDIDILYLIDPYDAYEDYEEVVASRSDVERLRSAKREAHQKVQNFDTDIVWIEEYSQDAAEEIASPLDFVYIDGNHGYEYVKTDLETYFPLVNEGGVLAGDDMNWSGVSRALAEFVVENEIQPHLCPSCSDWYIKVGEEHVGSAASA